MCPPLVLRIGTFGPRKVGKTVSLSVVTMCRGGTGLELALRDKATIAYFRPLVQGLQHGDFPPFTVPEMPKLLRWHADLGGRELDLQAADFAGELTDPIWNQGPEEFAHAVAAWFRQCDGMLLFVDATSTDPTYLDAIDKLLGELERQATRHGSRRRAIGVLVTKADELPGATPDNIANPQVADQLLARHPIYQRVKQQLGNKGQTLLYQLFLSSAVGWNFVPVKDKSQRTIEPCNLVEALRWVVEQAGQIVAETHERIMDEAETELAALERQADGSSFGLPNHTRMLAAVDRLIVEKNLQEGPHAGRADTLRQTIQQKRKRQRVSLALTAALLTAVALTGLWAVGRRAQEAIFDEHEKLVRESPGDDMVRDRLSHYDTHIGPREWDWFWGLGARRAEADAQAAVDRRVLARIEADEAFVRLVQNDPGLEKESQHPRRHQAVLDYFERHREATPYDRTVQLQALLDATRPAWEEDRQVWTFASSLRIHSPADYEEKIDRFRTYARRPDALSRSLAEQHATLLGEQKERDQAMYTELQLAVEAAIRSDAIEHTEQLSREYLALGEHGQAMGSTVQAFLAKLQRFKQPRNVSIKVKSVRVPKGFLDLTWTGNPKVTVKLTIGNQSWTTDVVDTSQSGDEFVASLGKQLGPFRVTWGEEQTLAAELKVHRSFFTEEKATEDFTDGVFVLNHANGKIGMTRSGIEGKPAVEVELECDDARLPSLPNFGSK